MDDAPKPQIDKFRELARELECDDDEAAFDEKVRRIATASSKAQPSKPEKCPEK